MFSMENRRRARRLCGSDIGAGSRPHVRPILVDVVETCLAAILLAGDGPDGRDGGGCWPERMLTLAIDQDDEGTGLIVEGVAHVSRSCSEVLVAGEGRRQLKSPISVGGVSSVLRCRSGGCDMRVADACFKLPQDLRGHVELSGHGDGVADSARGTEAIELPPGAPQDSLHPHVDDAGDRTDAV